MAEGFEIVIRGQEEFQAALREAQRDAKVEAQKGIREAGKVILAATRQRAPVGGGRDPHPGKLRASYRVSVRGMTGAIVSSAPYGAGAEWGQKGKWKGFMRYGAAGRFAARAIEETTPAIADTVTRAMTPVFLLGGWAH